MSHKLLAAIMETIFQNSERLSDEELNKLALWCDRLNGNRTADGTLRCKPLLIARVINARTEFRPLEPLAMVELQTLFEKGKKSA